LAEASESFVAARSDFLRDGKADRVRQFAAPHFEQLSVGWLELARAAGATIGDHSRRIAEAEDQSQFRLVDGPLVSAADIFPAVRDTSRDLLVPGLIEETVDFQRGSIQVELFGVVLGVGGGDAENVTD
jgi:hypothetical protein